LHFHDGESDWAGNVNLSDAVLLDSRRIGHTFNLVHFPAIEQAISYQFIIIFAPQ